MAIMIMLLIMIIVAAMIVIPNRANSTIVRLRDICPLYHSPCLVLSLSVFLIVDLFASFLPFFLFFVSLISQCDADLSSCLNFSSPYSRDGIFFFFAGVGPHRGGLFTYLCISIFIITLDYDWRPCLDFSSHPYSRAVSDCVYSQIAMWLCGPVYSWSWQEEVQVARQSKVCRCPNPPPWLQLVDFVMFDLLCWS